MKIPHLVQMAKTYLDNKLPAIVRGGYDFVDDRDIVNGCILVAQKGRKGEGYILFNRYYTIKDLFQMLNDITYGKRKKCIPLGIVKMSAPLIEFVEKAVHKRQLFTKYAVEIICSKAHYSHEKTFVELGYSTRDMRDALKDIVNWLNTIEK